MAAAKVITCTSRGKCILSVLSPVIPNTINKISLFSTITSNFLGYSTKLKANYSACYKRMLTGSLNKLNAC